MKKTGQLFLLGVCTAAVMFIMFPETARQGAKCSLSLCGETLVPGLFPFMVLGNMLVFCGGGEVLGKIFSPFVKKVLKMNGACALPIVAGLISGVPIGACITAEMVKKGEISPGEGERLLCLCNNPGPVFMLSAVPYMLGCDKKTGIILWASVIISSFVSMLFIKGKCKTVETCKNEIEVKSFAVCMIESVKKAVISMLNVCGFVVFYGTLTELIPNSLGEGKTVLTMIAEMTLGCRQLGNAGIPKNIRVIFASAVLGWTGLSAHSQVAASVLATGISMKNYFKGKAIQMALSPVITIVLIKVFPGTVAVSVTKTNPAIITVALSFMVLILVIIFALLILSIFSGSRKQVKR